MAEERFVGKESNKREAVDAEFAHDRGEVWAEYADPWRDPWPALVLPVLKRMPAKELVPTTGLSERAVKALRNRRASPRPAHREDLIRTAATFALDPLRARGIQAPALHLAACAAYPAAEDG